MPFKIGAGAETGGGVGFLLNIKDAFDQHAQVYRTTQSAPCDKNHVQK